MCHMSVTKQKKFTRPGDQIRNSNERAWTLAGLTTYNATRWDQLYKNQSNLRCSLRVKYEEFRILWGRQELKGSNQGMQIWVKIAPQHAHTVMMRLKQSFICTWNVKSQGNSGLQPENGILGKLGFLLLLSYQVLSCLDLRRSNLKTYLTFFIDQSDTAFLKTERKRSHQV